MLPEPDAAKAEAYFKRAVAVARALSRDWQVKGVIAREKLPTGRGLREHLTGARVTGRRCKSWLSSDHRADADMP